MRHSHIWWPFTAYETPESQGGAGTATPPAPQPPGQGSGGPTNGDFWGMFPDVPAEHRPLLEPHLRQHVLPHVTRLEQQLAPFKPFLDKGLTAENAEGLLKFALDYEQRPAELWLRMGQQLQQEGKVHGDLDLEVVSAVAQGQEPPAEEPVVTPQDGNVPPELQAFLGPLQQELADVKRALAERDERDQQTAQTEQQRQQQEMLQNAIGQIRSNLKEAGYPEAALTDELIRGSIIAAQGDPQKAEETLTATRNAVLQGFTAAKPDPNNKDLQLPNGTPPGGRKAPSRRGGSRDPGFDGAREKAEQYLAAQVAGSEE